MNPWKDRRTRREEDGEAPPKLCPGYPPCPKEERRLLNEVRAVGPGVPLGFKLSTGLKATEFCLQYIMKNHFKRKQAQSEETQG
jgi:hypothetical protein